MLWRKSLPARVALATAGLLTVLLLLLTLSAYALTAVLLRQGVDAALRTAVPLQGPLAEMMARANEFRGRDPGARIVQVLPADAGLEGGGELPVDPRALDAVRRERIAFSSVAPGPDGRLQVREEPGWWQALFPVSREIRVAYLQIGQRGSAGVMMVGMPLGPSGEVLPQVFMGMMALSAVGIVLAGLITWRMVGETYKPLRRITAIADSVTTKTLAVRIPDIWQDLTLHRLTTVLNEMVARLQEAFEVQGRFVASAAHELRGPLAAMRAELEVTLRRPRPAEEYREALEGALEETDRLTALAEHLLILARYERGVSLQVDEGLALAPLLHRVAGEIRRSLGAEVAVTVPGDVTVAGDPIALERVVANLARNGIEAGGAPVEMAVGKGAGGGWVWIAVRDHGPGVAPESVPMLFEPFYRADSARRRDAGVGLGLAIVKAIVDAHGGRIEVEQAEGGGARFVVHLPERQQAGQAQALSPGTGRSDLTFVDEPGAPSTRS
jgi:signal transduction histidine kinase